MYIHQRRTSLYHYTPYFDSPYIYTNTNVYTYTGTKYTHTWTSPWRKLWKRKKNLKNLKKNGNTSNLVGTKCPMKSHESLSNADFVN